MSQFEARHLPLGPATSEKLGAGGEYMLFTGDDDTTRFDPQRLRLDKPVPSTLPNVTERGFYYDATSKGQAVAFRVVSFPYHNPDSPNSPTQDERLVIVRGTAYGEYPAGHAGQGDSWYLVGPQIGIVSAATGEVTTAYNADAVTDLSPKNFSVACMQSPNLV